MRIRRGSADDAKMVAEIQVKGWQEAYKDIMPDEHLASMTTDNRLLIWQKLLTEGVTLVSEGEEGIVGFCSVGTIRDDDKKAATDGEVYALYVDPAMWRHGFGSKLCEAGLDWLKCHGFQSASLWVLEENIIGRGFYEKIGFKGDGKEKTVQLGGQELRELRYALDLAGSER